MLQTSSKASRTGYLFGIASAVTAGLIPVLSKLALVSVKPLTISALVFLAAGLMLLLYHPRERPSRKSAGWMLVTGLLGAALAPALYLYGLNQTSAVNASLLSNAEVFFTGVIAFAVFRESLKRRQLFESLIVVAGIFIVSTGLDFSSVQLLHGLAGNLLVLAAGLVWALDNNLSRVTSQKFGPVFVSKFRNIFGGGLLLGFLIATSAFSSVPIASVPILILYAADVALATLTFMAALVRIGAVRTLIAFSTTSIFGSAFSVAILGEGVTFIQATGGALILLGVYLIQKSESR
ncbi:MAG: DMT family transporter [Thaumarchaeota archaeon]|nr:DMT family transporter [Nitrososphaerota archaeon]